MSIEKAVYRAFRPFVVKMLEEIKREPITEKLVRELEVEAVLRAIRNMKLVLETVEAELIKELGVMKQNED